MYLDPLFGEKSSQTDRVKQSILLSQAGQLDQEYNMLEQVKFGRPACLEGIQAVG